MDSSVLQNESDAVSVSRHMDIDSLSTPSSQTQKIGLCPCPSLSQSMGKNQEGAFSKTQERASLINSCQRRTKQTFFSKQIFLFLLTITLFQGSGDQYSSINGSSNSCQTSGWGLGMNSVNMLLVSAATATASTTSKNDEERRNDKRKRVYVQSPASSDTIPTLQKVKNMVNGRPTAFIQQEAQSRQQQQQIVEIAGSQEKTFSEILKKAGKSGMGGGIPGFIAGVVQVLTLMWLRTVMNYQCRYGASFPQTLRILYTEGGIPRFYRGLSFALVQAPLARFVSTAANDGVETLLSNLKLTQEWGPGRSTVIASIFVGLFRIVLMPIDTCKTVLQVDSVEGFRNLMRKVKAGKIYVLYQGAFANAVSAIFAHYPWFYTYRILSKSKVIESLFGNNLLRNASIGFCSSVVSDTVANAIRVVKTTKQAIASKHTVGYGEVVAMILAADGWKGLFGRGLRTRILGNAVQSVMFTVIWRGLADKWSNKSSDSRRERQVTEFPTAEDMDDFDDETLIDD